MWAPGPLYITLHVIYCNITVQFRLSGASGMSDGLYMLDSEISSSCYLSNAWINSSGFFFFTLDDVSPSIQEIWFNSNWLADVEKNVGKKNHRKHVEKKDHNDSENNLYFIFFLYWRSSGWNPIMLTQKLRSLGRQAAATFTSFVCFHSFWNISSHCSTLSLTHLIILMTQYYSTLLTVIMKLKFDVCAIRLPLDAC